MKRFVIGALVAAVMVVPGFAGAAHDTPDGKDCREGNADVVTTQAESGQPDRGAVCVNVEGNTLLYVGGEAQPENEANRDENTGACGAIIVAGETVDGEDDWDNNGADGQANTADDEDCE